MPEKVLSSAAHLLLSLLTSVRPAQLYSSPLLQRLYADGITVPGCPQQVCFVDVSPLLPVLSSALDIEVKQKLSSVASL